MRKKLIKTHSGYRFTPINVSYADFPLNQDTAEISHPEAFQRNAAGHELTNELDRWHEQSSSKNDDLNDEQRGMLL